MTIIEEQFVHKVSLSSLVPKAPTPAASNQIGTGWHWEAAAPKGEHARACGT